MTNRSLQLDGLRGIAVSLVVLHHWTHLGQAIGIGLGNIGVQLFFVLSGFLITRILLNLREQCIAGKIDYRTALVSFHLNRIARIWPIFYATLALVFLMGDRFEARRDMVWHALFGSNFLFFKHGEFGSTLSHFWSLAVEQQFYLVWPFLVLLLPLRRLELTILLLIALAPVARVALWIGGGLTEFAQFNLLPIANFDSLGLGALAACWLRSAGYDRSNCRRVLSMSAIAAAITLVALKFINPLPANIEQTLYAIVFAWMVMRASAGFAGPFGRVLEMRALVSLGVISYGVYVYHMFAPRIVAAGLRGIAAPVGLRSGVALFVLSACLTLAVAIVSWTIVEKPILAWRRGAHARSPVIASQPASAS